MHYGPDIFRMKGILSIIRGICASFVFQGIRMLFDGRRGSSLEQE